MELLEIGKILRTHGIKGEVKVESFVDVSFKSFKHIYLTNKKLSANIKNVKSLNGDFYVLCIDIIPNIDVAETYKNQSIYIDRTEYPQFKNKLYMSDLIGKLVISETGEKLGEMVDYDDYGAGIILTIKCGVVSYSIPYVEDIIIFDRDKDAFIINKQKFEDLKVWK